MKREERDKFVEFVDVKDADLNLGFDIDLSSLEKGMKLMISPNFIFCDSTDKFTLKDAISCSNQWVINGAKLHYSDIYEIIAIHKRRRRGNKYAFLRVKNLRTNVDFDLIKDNFELDEYSTYDLYILI